MPHYKCTGCHHEFDEISDPLDESYILCDWCGAPSYILEEKTPLEKICDNFEEFVKKFKLEK
jgi:DNA-directed RNA polymerase subunit RPC12/RpoP